MEPHLQAINPVRLSTLLEFSFSDFGPRQTSGHTKNYSKTATYGQQNQQLLCYYYDLLLFLTFTPIQLIPLTPQLFYPGTISAFISPLQSQSNYLSILHFHIQHHQTFETRLPLLHCRQINIQTISMFSFIDSRFPLLNLRV